MFEILWNCVVDPAKGIKKAHKESVNNGLIALIVGILVTAVLGGLSAIASAQAMGSMYAAYGYPMPDMFGSFAEAFTESAISLGISFVGIIVTVYAIMNALGHRKPLKRFAADLSFPFSGMNVLVGVIGLVSVGSIIVLGESLMAFMGIWSYVLFLVLAYSYIVFTLSVKETYGVSLEKSAAVMIIVVALLNFGSIMSQLGASAA